MPLTERTKNLLLNAIAISPIMKWCSFPGIIGILLIGVGLWQRTTWLTVIGLVLAAPILWCYAVLLCVYMPYLLVESARQRLRK